MTLHGDRDVLDLIGQLVGGYRAQANGELLDRSFDAQTVTIDRLHVLRVHVAQHDVVSAARHVSTNGAADRSRPNDCQLHYVPLESARASG
jgi:hypothetical protein